MDDLVDQLGISKKTIYQYFKGKEDIIDTIITEMTLDMERQQIELFNDSYISVVDKMKALMTILCTQYDLITPITMNQLRDSWYSSSILCWSGCVYDYRFYHLWSI